jgi:hypothetical protein
VGAFTYRLLGEDGEDLGQLVSSQRSWRRGERLFQAGDGELEIVSVIPAEPGDDVRASSLARPELLKPHIPVAREGASPL